MHPRVLDERNTAAQKRLLEAARRLAESTGLKDELAALIHAGADQRDPAVAALFQREAIADLLEALAKSSGVVELTDESPVHEPGELPAIEPAGAESVASANPFADEPIQESEEPAELTAGDEGTEEPGESVAGNEEPDRKARRQRVRRLGKG